jgi:2Fe-2S ferredoxin
MELTHFKMITFIVRHQSDETSSIEVPEGINLSLMEVLKGSDYPIEATCGGMALCATCHIHVLKGEGQLPKPTDAELDMLDTLPDATSHSRLSCQLKISPAINGVMIELAGQAGT